MKLRKPSRAMIAGLAVVVGTAACVVAIGSLFDWPWAMLAVGVALVAAGLSMDVDE